MNKFKKLNIKTIKNDNKKKFIFLYASWLILWLFWFFLIIVYFTYIYDLPSINKISEGSLPESVIIYDRNWNEIYNIYTKEKRTYVKMNEISKNMQNAIVSIEDKTFFENSWFDFKWLIRAWFNYIVWKTEKVQWTSTISQQLIRNMFLTNERSIKRKIQELYLSYQLNVNFTKEKILELYLNKISFWSNAYWIEEASKTFFWKEAKNLWILESSILASLPKWPTFYSPYNHKDRLMWYMYVYNVDDNKNKIIISTKEDYVKYKALIDKFKSIITDVDINKLWDDKINICKLEKEFFKDSLGVNSKWCITINSNNIPDFLNSIKINYSWLVLSINPNKDVITSTWVLDEMQDLVFEYNTWRKDFVLTRMFEDNKIKIEDLKKSIIDWVDFQFKKYIEQIKYPHFVFYVKEYLENKYGKDFQSQWWLKIYTTIDPVLQDKAEELIKKQVDINKKNYWASNAALISIDNRTGQILSMIGWVNYFNNDQKWSNVNIITSERQPWSSFKPIEYAYAISKFPISPDTPIYDVNTKFSKWDPKNYDGKFLWRMTLRRALNYSRNIPAIKIFIYAWWEDTIVKFANELGINSLKLWYWYWAPLWIGTWELKPLELAQAYMVFANMWIKREVTPILKIEDSKWNIIEEYKKTEWKKIFSEVASYIISYILSDKASRPWDFWNNALTLKDRKVAAKTWTSNKEIKDSKWKKILPMDLWTVWYTPQITTVVWAWNTDWSATKWNWDWLNCAAPIWRDFMAFAHKNLEKLDFKEPEWVIRATISKSTWKLATSKLPDTLKINSIFAVKPYEYDAWWEEIEIDSLCNGKVTENTPISAIKKVHVSNSFPIIDSYSKEWLNSVQTWTNFQTWALDNIITSYDENKICERPLLNTEWISVWSNLINWSILENTKHKLEIRFDSNNPIIEVQILKNGTLVKKIPIESKISWNIDQEIDFWENTKWINTISIKVIDIFYFDKTISYEIDFWSYWLNVWDSVIDNSSWSNVNNSELLWKPEIIITNPKNLEINIYKDQYFNLRWNIKSESTINVINLYLNDQLFKILDWSNDFVAPINDKWDFQVGTFTLTIEVINDKWKKDTKNIKVNILDR